ncbi:MAG: ATP-binding protein [Polaribacter sp.]|uniref:ATP-binding protein n=1 Tax=Polaribacter sp. TaxID=1920175 RepID=UPI00326625FF
MIKKNQPEKELEKELWKTGQTIFWTLNAVILFTIAIDLILLSENWLEFVLLKLFLILFFYFTYIFFKKKYANPNLLIHLILYSFNFLTLISISHTGTINRFIYFTIIVILFILFNTIVIWKIINSVVQYLLVIITFIILVYLDIITTPEQILKEGGYIFLSIGFLSLFFPRIKETVLKERILNELKTYENIDYLQKELSQTKIKYKLLKEKVVKKENESKFLFQQISNDLNKINEFVANFENQTKQNIKIKSNELVLLIENLRNQSSVYFKPINLNTKNTDNYITDLVNITQVYINVIKTFRNQIKDKDLEFIENLESSNSLIIGNEKMIKTILYNILNFMVIFSNKHDEIEIQVKNLKNNTVFSLINKTNGLNTNEIESYFRDLEYVNYDYKKHSDSVKIGLRISKQLTQKMNGYFSYVSSEKMGFELKIQFKTYNKN